MSWLYTLLFTGLMFSSSPNEVSRTTRAIPVAEPAATVAPMNETEHFEQTYPLSANGRVALSNLHGSIRVEGWDRNEVKLSYTKMADTKERLSDVEVRIDARADSLRIEADYGNLNQRNDRTWRNGENLQIDFQLMVPRGAVLNEIETVNGSITASGFTNVTKISAVNGTVNATNIRGTAKFSTVNGEVFADLDRLESGSKISLETVNGKVNLAIPSDANATLKADSLNGVITNDFGLPVRKGKYVGRDLYGRLGTGEVQISLNSVNGPLVISHRSDGRSVSPAVNLLPQKDDDDIDAEVDTSVLSQKINKQIDKSVKDNTKMIAKAQARAVANAQIDLQNIRPEIDRATIDAMREAGDSVKIAGDKIKEKIKIGNMKDLEELGRIGDVSFISGLPKVEEKSGNYHVTGTPRVTVDAPGCSVTVRGWDKNEVEYRVTRTSSLPNASPLAITDDHTDSSVTLKVQNAVRPAIAGPGVWGDLNNLRIEMFVPRKTNLKITATGAIRLDGVSGDLQLDGKEDSINVRDGDGTLRIASTDGRIRVIGFRGDVNAESADGDINLEGDFTNLSARASNGDVTLTLPDNISADLDTTSEEVSSDKINLSKLKADGDRSRYRMGKGGNIFKVETDGEVLVRGLSAVRSVQ
jgi:DUF4097 and DUF4098 domain-containing protein YvlB